MRGKIFRDRREAGRELAGLLGDYRSRDGVIVLGLPRGGVPVAFEVARALDAPLEVFTVRKIGVPGHEELAMGAVASGGVVVTNYQVVEAVGVPHDQFDLVVAREKAELTRRERLYRGPRPAPDLFRKTVLLVDDGLATGATMRATVSAVREFGPERIVVAIPTAPSSACREISALVDEVVCVDTPHHFSAVGQSYEVFDQTSDDEVRDLLEQAVLPDLSDDVDYGGEG
ncbi:phosphoribosyltransferase [Glycomyces buryatensis]|uniref:Phosphoribosyltransferase n=1 Tax=Glycomyces buryatensis TaxID=2570927 RepID=A0A4S8Q3E6_9ACTN|nr:phosphoribosyltransferase [Glycomyces buryatensis]THV37045.1 phosphoribosyltransferase [Glycomyces buryatensis]